ncbi:unnamed protein product, partial [Urochloa humidicola]
SWTATLPIFFLLDDCSDGLQPIRYCSGLSHLPPNLGGASTSATASWGRLLVVSPAPLRPLLYRFLVLAASAATAASPPPPALFAVPAATGRSPSPSPPRLVKALTGSAATLPPIPDEIDTLYIERATGCRQRRCRPVRRRPLPRQPPPLRLHPRLHEPGCHAAKKIKNAPYYQALQEDMLHKLMSRCHEPSQ